MLVDKRTQLAIRLEGKKRATLKKAMGAEGFRRSDYIPVEWIRKMANSEKESGDKSDENLVTVCETFCKYASCFQYAARASCCWSSTGKDTIHRPTWIVSFLNNATKAIKEYQGIDKEKFHSSSQIVFKNYTEEPSIVGIRFENIAAFSPLDAAIRFCNSFQLLFTNVAKKHKVELSEIEKIRVYPEIGEDIVAFAEEGMRRSCRYKTSEYSMHDIEQEARLLLYKMYSQLQHVHLSYSKSNPPRPQGTVYLSDFNNTEQCIIEALGKKAMTGEEIAPKAGYSYNSNFKATLAQLRKREILGNKSPGYFLVPEYHFLLDDIDESQDFGQD
ncbi:MAG: hypothetical protein FVQ82_04650 [Planctomycetes bacterium]|nr:hypothetical protein [Planctomycetota bacterium]